MTKFNLTSAREFDFIDHEHGTTTPHLVGHEEESHWDSLLIDNHYTFELDGVDVWKHLKEHGISVDTNFTVGEATAVGKSYRILRDGYEIARTGASDDKGGSRGALFGTLKNIGKADDQGGGAGKNPRRYISC